QQRHDLRDERADLRAARRLLELLVVPGLLERAERAVEDLDGGAVLADGVEAREEVADAVGAELVEEEAGEGRQREVRRAVGVVGLAGAGERGAGRGRSGRRGA